MATPQEPGINPEMEFDPLSEKITKQYCQEVGSVGYYQMLMLVDQMVRAANPDHPDFHVRFALAMFQGVHTNEQQILPQPSSYDVKRLKSILESATGQKAAPSFDAQFFPRKVNVHTIYGVDDLDAT